MGLRWRAASLIVLREEAASSAVRARRCIIDAFSTEYASIGVEYGEAVVQYFEALLAEELEKAGLVVEAEPTLPQPDHVMVEGNFRKIDVGNRLLRCLFRPFTPLFGATLWVQGICSVGDQKVSDFDVVTTHGGGLYAQFALGGKSEAVLERCVRKAAKNVSREVVRSLNQRLAAGPVVR